MTETGIDLPPYARTMGITLDHWSDGAPVLAFDYCADVGGNPGAFHGGALGGLLELAALTALRAMLDSRGSTARLKPINVSIEYLRGAGPQRTYALGTVVRAGRRLANVRAQAWQDDPARPVATILVNVALEPAESPGAGSRPEVIPP